MNMIDLIDVMEEVMALGPALKLRSPDLDIIKKKCGNSDPTECLRDTLEAWLQRRYEIWTTIMVHSLQSCKGMHRWQ